MRRSTMRTIKGLLEEGVLMLAGGIMYALDMARHVLWSLTSAPRRSSARRRVNEALVSWRVHRP